VLVRLPPNHWYTAGNTNSVSEVDMTDPWRNRGAVPIATTRVSY